MSGFAELLSNLESVLTDMKVDSMLADLLEHTSKAEDYDDFTREMARSRTTSFMRDHVKDFDMAFYHLSKFHAEHKKIALASAQLPGQSDETAIPCGALQSVSERSLL